MKKQPRVYDIPADARWTECREPTCRARITFVRTASGKPMPVTEDGVSHYTNCTKPKQFSKPKGNR